VNHPDGARRIEAFTIDPWPTWIYQLEDGTRIRQEILMGEPGTGLAWTVLEGRARLSVRLFLAGRDYHALHHENPSFRFEPRAVAPGGLAWRPYPDLPEIHALTNASYRHDPHWYRNFLLDEERERGLDHVEDLAAPGVFEFEEGAPAQIVLTTGARASVSELRARPERDRVEHYLVRRGTGRTIMAGYPWFTDWGRDTFIALRGLCLATRRLGVAGEILHEWAGAVSDGMLPNRFPDRGESPEYNSVDASLWYVVAVGEYLRAVGPDGALSAAVDAILSGYSRGTRHGIRLDEDGLLVAGVPGHPADLDGRQDRRLGGDPADRQARRGAGALGQRARGRRGEVAVGGGPGPAKLCRPLLEW
jgi:glycogen debranching enzyme